MIEASERLTPGCRRSRPRGSLGSDPAFTEKKKAPRPAARGALVAHAASEGTGAARRGTIGEMGKPMTARSLRCRVRDRIDARRVIHSPEMISSQLPRLLE